MLKRKLPVIAAIPAFNAETTLKPLLSEVLEQEYDDVYILDDASTDSTYELAHSFGPDIKIVKGLENIGSGANRNRIIPELGDFAILHFIDADVRLNSERNPEKARELTLPSDTGFVGGLVRLPDGSQNPWNYGPAFSLPQMVSSWVYSGVHRLGKRTPKAAHVIRNELNRWSLIRQWPDTLSEPVARDVYWSGEANMVILSDVFERVGGYDPRLRYHEVMELAMRLERLHLKRRFDPSIDVTHQSIELMNKGYTREFWVALARIAGNMGINAFLFPSKNEL